MKNGMHRAMTLASLAALLASAGGAGAAEGIAGVMPATATVETVRGGFVGLEGPVSDGDGGLYFDDVRANTAYHLNAAGEVVAWRSDTQGANGEYRTRGGVLYVAEGAGKRVVSFAADGTMHVVAQGADGQPLREPNDVITDDDGRVYFTDPAPRPSPTESPKEHGNLDFIGADGNCHVANATIVRPNGLVLSVDGRTLYVDDTEGDAIYAFPRAEDGTLGEPVVYARLAELEQGPAGLRSRADGMTIDADGRLYVSTAAGVQVISTAGQVIGIIRAPALVRNVAFAGRDRHDLYLTTAQTLLKVRLQSHGLDTRSR